MQVRPRASILPGPTDQTEAAAFRRNQLALIRSTDVLTAALRNPAVRDALQTHPEPVAWLASHLTAEYVHDSEILRVGVTDLSPRETVAVVNAIVEHYVDRANVAEHQRQMDRDKRIRLLRDDLRKMIDHQRLGLRRMAEESLPVPGEMGKAKLAALYQEQSGLRIAAVGVAGDAAKVNAYAAELKAVEDRIRSAEKWALDTHSRAAEIAALDALDAALAAEQNRGWVERASGLRVSVVQQAAMADRTD